MYLLVDGVQCPISMSKHVVLICTVSVGLSNVTAQISSLKSLRIMENIGNLFIKIFGKIIYQFKDKSFQALFSKRTHLSQVDQNWS